MKYFIFIMIFCCSLFSLSCRSRKTNSGTKTFSSEKAGYSFFINGEIDLTPPDRDVLEQIVLWNAKELIIRHPGNKDWEEYWKNLNDEDQAKRKSALDEAIDLFGYDDPGNLIEKQLLYRIYFKESPLAISLDQTTLRYQKVEAIPFRYKYSVKASVVGTEEIQDFLANETFYFPLNPLMVFYQTNSFESIADIELTRDKSREFECFIPDGDPVAPHNYFYYLNPYDKKECLEKYKERFISVRFENVTSQGMKPVYPEFQALFADNKLDVLIGVNEVDETKTGYKTYLSITRQLEYGQKMTVVRDDKNDVLLEKKIAGNFGEITISIRVVFSENNEETVKIFRSDDGIASHEIIIFSGHAGYGRDLFDIFNTKTPYPKGKYQIFFPYSCWSYGYAVSNIIASKAILDLDPKLLYVDIISTINTAVAMYDFPVINAMMGFFLEAAKAYGSSEIKDFTYQTLLKKMDQSDMPDKAFKAEFTVAGEENNVFRPDARPEELILSSQYDGASLEGLVISLITDQTKDESFSESVLRGLLISYGQKGKKIIYDLIYHNDPLIRKAMVRNLANFGDLLQEKHPILISKLLDIFQNDMDPEVKRNALKSLGKIGANDVNTIGVLAASLKEEKNNEIIYDIVCYLSNVWPYSWTDELEENLVRIIEYPDFPEVKGPVFRLLKGKPITDSLKNRLVTMLNKEEAPLQILMKIALILVYTDQKNPEVIKTLKNAVRSGGSYAGEAVTVLGRLNLVDDDIRKNLVANALMNNSPFRTQAIHALGNIRYFTDELIEVWRNLVNKGVCYSPIRLAAAYALAKTGNEQLIDEGIAFLQQGKGKIKMYRFDMAVEFLNELEGKISPEFVLMDAVMK